jgi:CheY-like chemotaxis protein
MTPTVLIVDDNDVCRDALEAVLGKLPRFAVRTVTTAEQALECLAADDICALVTDLHLGRMDGFELIALIRSHPRRSTLPILVISGDNDPGTAARVAEVGADAYFTKPYSPAAVYGKLEELVDAR